MPEVNAGGLETVRIDPPIRVELFHPELSRKPFMKRAGLFNSHSAKLAIDQRGRQLQAIQGIGFRDDDPGATSLDRKGVDFVAVDRFFTVADHALGGGSATKI